MEDIDVSVGGMPMVIKWDITHHMLCSFEIDTAEVEKLLPEELVPVEVRPEVSLLHVSGLQYAPGNFGPGSPVFYETLALISVQPNQALAMPSPRFTFYVITVLSDSPQFVDGEAERLYTPTELSPGLRAEFTADGLGVRIFDDHGSIATLKNTKPGEPKYRYTTLWGQHFNDTRAQLYNGAWQWEGLLLEHQRQGNWGELFPHPMFKGLDVSKVRTCYLQFWAKANTSCIERFYQIQPL